MQFISDGRPLSSEESAEISERSLRMWHEYGFGPWAAIEKDTRNWIGRIGLNELPWWQGPHRIEVGFELRRDFWGRGFATEGALEALAYGFQDHGLDRIISVTRSDHAASRRVMEKIGLEYQGLVELDEVQVAWYAADREVWVASHQSETTH
jgi:RimJ/RimL family protein N-acetyltransferase